MSKIPSPSEIEAAKSPAGGWSRETLEGWGLPWPAPRGWRRQLKKRWWEMFKVSDPMTIEDLIGGVDATDECARPLGASVWFDGSCGPRNPGGTAKGGWVIETNDGRRIEGKKVIAEHSTNNVAEFGALIGALNQCSEFGIKVVQIRGDSKLVVETVSRRWRCKARHLKPMLDEALNLLRRFEWTIKWVPREQNRFADHLSK